MKTIDSLIELERSQIIQNKTVVKREQEMSFNSCPCCVIRFLNKWSDLKLTETNEDHFEAAQERLMYYTLLN